MKRKLLLGILTILIIGFNMNTFAQGETCGTAVAVTTGIHTADGPATGGGAANICYTSATNADWYSYTPAESGTVAINSCGGGADTRLSFYDGDCTTLSCVANNDDACDMGTGDAYASEITGISVTGGVTYYIEWDNRWDNTGFDWTLTFTPLPACPVPTAQTETNITSSTVDLGWTTGGATTWDIEWGISGFTPATGTTITGITTNPYSLSGLTVGTSYDWYVRDDCGGGVSDWTGPHTFTTLPGPHSFPLTEDFESGFASFDNATGNSVDWVLNTSIYHSSTTSAHNAYTSSNANILHETGILDLSGTSAAMIEFWQIAKTEGTYDKCYIEISTNGGSTYTALPAGSYQGAGTGYATAGYFDEDDYSAWGTGTETPDNTWWRKETFSLASYNTTNVRFRFRLTSDGSAERAGWYLDDIHIYEPSCPAPSALTETNIGITSVDLGWTESGTATTWNIEWKAGADFTPGTGAEDGYSTILTTPTDYLSGLTISTTYYWYVQADCGGSTSTWTGPHNFTTSDGKAINPTPADAATEVAVTATTLDWDDVVDATSYTISIGTTTGGTDIANGVACATSTYTYGSNWDYSTQYFWTVTTEYSGGTAVGNEWDFTTECGTYSTPFSEDFNGTYVPSCWFEATGDVPTPTPGSSVWGQSDNFANASGNSKGVKMNVYSTDNDWLISPDINLGTGNRRIIFKVAATTYNGTGAVTMAAEDNVYVLIKDAAGTWDLGNALADYTSGNTPSNTGDDIIIDLTGWTGVVNFAFYTKGSGNSPDMDIHFDDFVVEEIPLCTEPTALISSNINATSVDLGWTESGSATSWNIEWGFKGFSQGFGNTISATTNNPYSLTGLSPGFEYEWYVQAICGVGDESPWAGPTGFSTEPLNDDCSNAVSLTVGYTEDWTLGTNVGATDSNNNPDPIPAPGCASYSGGDVWYSATVPASGYLVVTSQKVVGSPFLDSGMGIYTGTCGSLVLFECDDDDSPDGFMSQVTINDITLANTTVYIRFWEYGNNIFGMFEITAYSAPTSTNWAGTTDNDWYTASNWDVAVPGTITDVTIPAGLTNYPTLTSAGSCNNLTIQSTASGSGSLIGQSYLTVNGTTIIERYTTAGVWHGISGPLDNDDFNSLYLGGSPNVWGMSYNEAGNTYTNASSLSTDLGDAKGWMVWIEGSTAQTFSFTGDLRSTLSPLSLTNTGPDALHGYNFIGNPYPSAIDWDAALGLTKINVGAGIWVYNPDGGGGPGWATYVSGSPGVGLNGGSQYISTSQGFFVQVDAGQSTGTLELTADIQVHSNTAFMKAPASSPTDFIKLKLADGSLYDESIIRLDAAATEGYDGQFDMHKMFSWSEDQPQLYSTANNFMAINVLPLETVSVPMDVRGVDGNEMTLSLEEVTDFVQVYLSDNYTGAQTNLMETPYSFIYDAGQTDRFTIYFTVVGTQENELDNIRVFSFDQKIRVVIPMEMNSHVEVVNMLGQKVIATDAHLGTQDIQINQRGYYLVNITGENQCITKKVFIQ
ncbi:MAG: fibronectin type III domain-containing protein [Bacteroidales bacterium]|nr:fibronectin type III domain-containing protein [Bacteroidales bacterium]